MEPSELAAVAGRYRDMIYRVALHWCGHPQEAEDATQDTLLKLCATHRTFADEEHLKSWLIRVTINHCKSRLRAPWHTRRLPLEELPDTPVFDDPAQRELYDAVLALHRRTASCCTYFIMRTCPLGRSRRCCTSARTP